MSPILPWQTGIWQDLQQRVVNNTLPHALLFTGVQGTGKALLAEQFAHCLLCKTPGEDGSACGTCGACHLLRAGSHPDFRRVEPEEEGKVIPVDRIRAIGEFLALKGQYSGRQIVLIHPAEAMNRFAANSLLKTLEEPTPEALLILISSRPSLLLPTIRSRCQRVLFATPPSNIALKWLQQSLGKDVDSHTLLALANGAPLAAKSLHDSGALVLRKDLAEAWLQVAEGRGDPLDCASRWLELGLVQAVNWLSSWIMDLIRLKSGAEKVAIVNCDLLHQLQKIAGRVDLQQLFFSLEQITEYNRWAGGQLNEQLALEDIMIGWSRSTDRLNKLAATHSQRGSR